MQQDIKQVTATRVSEKNSRKTLIFLSTGNICERGREVAALRVICMGGVTPELFWTSNSTADHFLRVFDEWQVTRHHAPFIQAFQELGNRMSFATPPLSEFWGDERERPRRTDDVVDKTPAMTSPIHRRKNL